MGSERLVLPLSWFLESELIVGQIMSLNIFEPIIGLVPAWGGTILASGLIGGNSPFI